MSELDKYAITAWVPTDGDLNGKQVTQKVIPLDIANSVVKNLLLEAQIKEVERFLVEPGEVIPYNNNTFSEGFRYVTDKLQKRLSELQEMLNHG